MSTERKHGNGFRKEDPYGDFLSLNVTLNDSRIDPDLAMEAVSYFGLKKDEAAEDAKQILSTVGRSWRAIAESYGLSRESQDAMAPAFSICSGQ